MTVADPNPIVTSALNDIKNAVYGKDVRVAIHDSIKAMNDALEDVGVEEIVNARIPYNYTNKSRPQDIEFASIGDAIRGQIKDTNAIISGSLSGLGYMDIPFTKKENGYTYMTQAGVFRTIPNVGSTEFIDVTGFNELLFSTEMGSTYTSVTFIDEDFNVMVNDSLGPGVYKSYKVTIPNNAKYVVVSYYINYTAITKPLARLIVNEERNAILYKNNALFDRSITSEFLVPKETWKRGSYISLNGYFDPNGSNGMLTDYIFVKDIYDEVEVKSSISDAGYSVAFYDFGFNFISGVKGNGYSVQNAKIPNDAYYAKCSAYVSQSNIDSGYYETLDLYAIFTRSKNSIKV